MKIAIIGTHCTGKTTLTEKTADYLQSKGLNVGVVKEIVRKCPYPVNEKGTVEAQKWVFLQQVKEEEENSHMDVVVCDRSVLDNYAYLVYTQGEKKEFYGKVLSRLKTYDILFVTSIDDNKMECDGFRSTNPEFRQGVQNIIFSKIEELSAFFKEQGIKVVNIGSFDDIKGELDKDSQE